MSSKKPIQTLKTIDLRPQNKGFEDVAVRLADSLRFSDAFQRGRRDPSWAQKVKVLGRELRFGIKDITMGYSKWEAPACSPVWAGHDLSPERNVPILILPVIHIQKMHRLGFSFTIVIFLLGTYVTVFAAGTQEEFPVSPPPMTEGMFPCNNCHASLEVNRKKRELKEEHADIKLHHAESMRWCLDCHDARNRDKLRLYNGELINFTESYRLCGECHGNVYRTWRAGIHGKRTGFFSGPGKRTYFLCAHCHDPHEPKFKPLKPEPPPHRPEEDRHAKSK